MRSLSGVRGIWRALLLTAGSVAILLTLQAIGWVDLRRIATAFIHHPLPILGIALTQLGIVLTTPMRYHATLRACGLPLPFRTVFMACTVSACIAPWLPGSAAAGEAIRTGWLLSRGSGEAPAARLLAATGMDNGIRLFLDLTIGFGSGLLLLALDARHRSLNVSALVGGLGIGCLMLGSLPLLVRVGRGRWWPVPFAGGNRCLLASLLIGVAPPLLNGLGFVLAARAVHANIGLLMILVAYPLVLISSVLPLGIAGIGGNQVITVALFALLGISAEDATSTELLHTGVVLILNGLISIPFLPLIPRIVHARDPHLSRD